MLAGWQAWNYGADSQEHVPGRHEREQKVGSQSLHMTSLSPKLCIPRVVCPGPQYFRVFGNGVFKETDKLNEVMLGKSSSV